MVALGRHVRAEANPRAESCPMGWGFKALCLQMSFRRKGVHKCHSRPEFGKREGGEEDEKGRKKKKQRRAMGENRTGKRRGC